MQSRTVLISGAGIAGPTLAWWLRRYGFVPTLVERAPAPRTGGYMIDFWGAGYDVAERMDLLPTLHELAYALNEVRIVDARGRRISGFSADAFRAAAGGRFFSILRGDLASAIYSRVDGEVETIFGDSVTGLEEDGDGVTVSFERHPPRRFDLVAGADGLHSKVRSLAFGPEAAVERFLGYYTAAFNAPGYPHRDEGVYVSFCVPGLQIARYALRDGSSAFFFILARDEPLPANADAAAHRRLLHEAFAGAGWESAEVLAAMDRCDDLYFDAVAQIRLPHWSRGRVVLLGDAAYCPSLLAGQGSAFAMIGAYLLATELAAAGGDHRTAFAEYERRFKPFVDAKQDAAARFGGWFAPRTRGGLWLRNQVTRALNLPFVGEWVVARSLGDDFELPAAAHA